MDDLIYSSRPINRTAGLVISRGEHWNPSKKIRVEESETPIPTKCCEGSEEDLTGARRGRFTVIGKSRDKKGRWVVRCDCGRYTFRRAKSIKNECNEQDRCELCRELAYQKREEFRRRTGKDIDIRKF